MLKSIEVLIKAGADVNTTDAAGNVPLISVIHFNHEECVPLLLESGADVNATEADTGSSALIIAVTKCKDEALEQLTKAGADVNIVNKKGDTALTIAAADWSRKTHIVRHLLKANCRINKFSGMKRNALMSHLKLDQPVYSGVTRPLSAAGEIADDSVFCSLLNWKDAKMPLKHICREAIRNHLLKLDPTSNLFGRIPRLGLPSLLNRYLLYDVNLE